MELVILMGLQASGKSTFARERFAMTHERVSKELLRYARPREGRQRALVERALAAGRSVVVDNTNPRAEDRAPLIAIARAHGARIVGYYFESRVEECLARNRAREGRERVPDVALYVTRRRLQEARREEGFDELYDVRIGPAGFEVRPWDDAVSSRSRTSS